MAFTGRAGNATSIRLGAAAAALAAAVLTLAGPAGASTAGLRDGSAAARHAAPAVRVLHLRAMPRGTVTFGRRHHRLTARVVMFGLTPGSSHAVRLVLLGRPRVIRFSTLTANGTGQATSVLRSHFTGRLPRRSRLVIRMGLGGSRLARTPIAVTRWQRHPGRRRHALIAVEVSPRGISYGTPRGRATISYHSRSHTLVITVRAAGVTPGPHAAHVHLGSCQSQGPVLYMLRDLIANRRGVIAHAVRVITHVSKPIPAHGWYLNIHQGNSKTILRGGKPTILFRPLLCRNIR